MIDRLIAQALHNGAVDLVASLPCNMLSGVCAEIDRLPITRIPVCREEEGVGIAAGAALAGRRPALLMQNSGLGNSMNALASLTCFYRLPLVILMSHRGGPEEKIAAQIPMGLAAPRLLEALSIAHLRISSPADIDKFQAFIHTVYTSGAVGAAFLSPELWHAKT